MPHRLPRNAHPVPTAPRAPRRRRPPAAALPPVAAGNAHGNGLPQRAPWGGGRSLRSRAAAREGPRSPEPRGPRSRSLLRPRGLSSGSAPGSTAGSGHQPGPRPPGSSGCGPSWLLTTGLRSSSVALEARDLGRPEGLGAAPAALRALGRRSELSRRPRAPELWAAQGRVGLGGPGCRPGLRAPCCGSQTRSASSRVRCVHGACPVPRPPPPRDQGQAAPGREAAARGPPSLAEASAHCQEGGPSTALQMQKPSQHFQGSHSNGLGW